LVDYYYADGDVQRGPFPLADLARHGLRADTLVWREGMPDWRRADAVPEVWAVVSPPPAGGAFAGGPMPDARIDALPGTPTIPLADERPTAGGYGRPAYGTPAYGTPAYGTPTYGTPAY